MPLFIKQEDWPNSSADLNPSDYGIWGLFKSKINFKQDRSLDSLKAPLLYVYDKLLHKMVYTASE